MDRFAVIIMIEPNEDPCLTLAFNFLLFVLFRVVSSWCPIWEIIPVEID